MAQSAEWRNAGTGSSSWTRRKASIVNCDPAAKATERTFSGPPSSMASAYWCPIGLDVSPLMVLPLSDSRSRSTARCINRFGYSAQGFWQFCRYSGGETSKTTDDRSEEHTSELQSLMRNSYAVFCLKNKT